MGVLIEYDELKWQESMGENNMKRLRNIFFLYSRKDTNIYV